MQTLRLNSRLNRPSWSKSSTCWYWSFDSSLSISKLWIFCSNAARSFDWCTDLSIHPRVSLVLREDRVLTTDHHESRVEEENSEESLLRSLLEDLQSNDPFPFEDVWYSLPWCRCRTWLVWFGLEEAISPGQRTNDRTDRHSKRNGKEETLKNRSRSIGSIERISSPDLSAWSIWSTADAEEVKLVSERLGWKSPVIDERVKEVI